MTDIHVNRNYLNIALHYEECLEMYGDSHLGVDWPNEIDTDKRYEVMLEVIKQTREGDTLLDFGCGASHLYEYIQKKGIKNIEYSGLDISEKFISLCKAKYPNNHFFVLDILQEKTQLPDFDYIVMNGVFTEKRELSHQEMLDYFKEMVRVVFNKAKEGIAFNVMTKHVDWERNDLFHLPFDELASFLTKEVSRKFIFRNDYGLYEYTAYVYR